MVNFELVMDGSLAHFGADIIHEKMGFNDATVRQWRKRGFFDGGDKFGRKYLYTIEDIAKLAIVRELSDVGVRMVTAATAADRGAETLVAHILLRAPLISIEAPQTADLTQLVKYVWDNSLVEKAMNASDDVNYLVPAHYLVTGGDDFDDWTLIDDLDDIDRLSDFNLAVIHIDLRKLADRVIEIMTRVGTGTGDEASEPEALVNFYTEDVHDFGPPARITFPNSPPPHDVVQ